MYSRVLSFVLCSLLALTSQARPMKEPSHSLQMRNTIAHRTDNNLDRRANDPLTEGPNRLSIHVTIVIDPSNITTFLEALKPAFDAVANEKLNTFFEVFQSPENRGEFRFVEHWSKDIDWFNNVQLKKSYYKPYLAITEPMWLKPRQFEYFERLDPCDWLRVKL